MPSSNTLNGFFRSQVIIWQPYHQQWLADALWRMRFDINGWSWSDVTKYMNYQAKQIKQRPIFVEPKVKSYATGNEETLKKLEPNIEATEKCCALNGIYCEPLGGVEATHVARGKEYQKRLKQQQQQLQYQQQRQLRDQHERHQRKQQLRQQLRIRTAQQMGQVQQMQQQGQTQIGQSGQIRQIGQTRQFDQGTARQALPHSATTPYNPHSAKYPVSDEQRSRSNH